MTVPTTTNVSSASTSVSFNNTSPLLLPVEVPETADPPFETASVAPSCIYPVSFVVEGASFTPITLIVIKQL